MYCPTPFEEQRPEVLRQLIGAHPLATLIRQCPDGLVADHIPLLHVPTDHAGGQGQLIGHVARANPLWQVSPDEELLLVFRKRSIDYAPCGSCSTVMSTLCR